MESKKKSLIASLLITICSVFVLASIFTTGFIVYSELQYSYIEQDNRQKELSQFIHEKVKSRVVNTYLSIMEDRDDLKKQITTELSKAVSYGGDLITQLQTYGNHPLKHEEINNFIEPLKFSNSSIKLNIVKPLDLQTSTISSCKQVESLCSLAFSAIQKTSTELLNRVISNAKGDIIQFSYFRSLDTVVFGTINNTALENEIKNNILKKYSRIKFQDTDEGYLFVTGYDGKVYFTQGKYHGQKLDLWETMDSNGHYYVQESTAVARNNPHGGFIYYGLTRDEIETQKVAFIKSLPDWDAYIGSGVSLGHISEKLSSEMNARKQRTLSQLLIVLTILIISLGIGVLIIVTIMKKYSTEISSFQEIIKKSSENEDEVDIEKLAYKELYNIAFFSNRIIDKLKKKNNTLENLAMFDLLTGLPSRFKFEEYVEMNLQQCKTMQEIMAIFYIDLDDFKEINDTLGHHTGDLLLKQIAEKLLKSLGNQGIVSRIGGDEFLIALPNLKSTHEAEQKAEIIIDSLRLPFELSGNKHRVSVSIGGSLYPNDAQTCSTLLSNADLAMYQAKKNGKNSYSFFTASLLDNMKFRSGLAAEIDRAIKCGEMELHYQPQIDLKTQEIIGAEALIRWRDPASGWISPDKFIPVLEEIGQMYTLGSWVALEAAYFLEKIRKEFNFSGKIAINVSGINISDGNLVDYIKEAISISGSTPDQLEVEITESIIMTNNTIALQQLEALQNIGISVAIDDFGTGYSSLGQLKNFPVNKLKIDRTFVDDLTDGLNDRAIIKAIISLAKTLNLKVIAEGIETAEQLAILIEEGCDYGQGYFLGRPIPNIEFEKLLQSGN